MAEKKAILTITSITTKGAEDFLENLDELNSLSNNSFGFLNRLQCNMSSY